RFQLESVLGMEEEKKTRVRKKDILPPSLSRKELQRAVILSEVLSPPLALRRKGEGPLAPRIEDDFE
ncbi:MAG: hypothetical protein ACYTHM_21980, partial [Planctomycetota bacterium]